MEEPDAADVALEAGSSWGRCSLRARSSLFCALGALGGFSGLAVAVIASPVDTSMMPSLMRRLGGIASVGLIKSSAIMRRRNRTTLRHRAKENMRLWMGADLLSAWSMR